METQISPPGIQEQVEAPSAPSRTGRPAGQGDELSWLDLMIVLAARKRFLFKVTAIFALLSIAIAFLLPPRYTAKVLLLPPQQSTSMATLLASQLSNLGSMASLAGSSLGIKNPNDTYVGMLKSRTVEDGMIERFGLAQEYHARRLSDARETLERRVTIDGSGKDGLIHISVEDRDPRRAAQLANGYVDQYRNLSEHLAITEASQRRLFFERQLEEAKNNLTSAEEALKTTEQTTGLIQLDSQARALIQSAVTLRAQAAAKQVQIEAMRTYATGENAQLKEAEQELESLRAQLAKLSGSEGGGDEGMIVSKGRVPEAGLEYLRKYRDVKYYETIFEILAKQFELAKLDEAKQGAVIQVVDSATVPDRKSFPKRGLIILGATLLGFFFASFFALLQAVLGRMKKDPDAGAKLALLKRSLALKGPRP